MLRRLPLLLAALAAACASASVVIKPGFDFSVVKRVAVVRFADYPRRRGSGDLVTGAFEQGLLAAGYDVIERSRVDEVLRGKNLGALDAKALSKLGKTLGVDAFVAGQITDFREPREETVYQDVVDTHNDPVYVRRKRQTTKDGRAVEVEESVLEGYRTTRVLRREPRTMTVDGRLGLSARLVHSADGQVLWSGSDVRRIYSIEEGARDLAGAILDAVKTTVPK
jgi:hypothetical protein